MYLKNLQSLTGALRHELIQLGDEIAMKKMENALNARFRLNGLFMHEKRARIARENR